VTVALASDFLVVGWAIDDRHHTIAADVDVMVDDTPFPAFYGLDRLDVAKSLGTPDFRLSGFTARLSGADMTRGAHMLSIRTLSADRGCYYRSPGIPIVAQ
jgi:hypothetical protein